MTTKYLYDGLNLIAELNGSDVVTAWYVYAGLDRPLARVDGATGTVLYYHTDILGSAVALTDSAGAVVTQYNYSPFGQTEVIGADVPQPFRFTGREYDPETGAHGAHRLSTLQPDPGPAAQREASGGHAPRARYYSPEMRRFISEDPIRKSIGLLATLGAGDVNFYAYVGNNPLNFNDPLGFSSVDLAGPLLDLFGWLGLIDLADTCDPRMCVEARKICEREINYWIDKYDGNTIKADLKMMEDYNHSGFGDGVHACTVHMLESAYRDKLSANDDVRMKLLNDCVTKAVLP